MRGRIFAVWPFTLPSPRICTRRCQSHFVTFMRVQVRGEGTKKASIKTRLRRQLKPEQEQKKLHVDLALGDHLFAISCADRVDELAGKLGNLLGGPTDE